MGGSRKTGSSWRTIMLAGFGIYGIFILAGRTGRASDGDDDVDLLKCPPKELGKQDNNADLSVAVHDLPQSGQTQSGIPAKADQGNNADQSVIVHDLPQSDHSQSGIPA